MLGPLLGAALDNALRSGDAALTGPVARGDAGTVAAHLASCARTPPARSPAYVAMARATAERALAPDCSSAELAEALLGVLADGGEPDDRTGRAHARGARGRCGGPAAPWPSS